MEQNSLSIAELALIALASDTHRLSITPEGVELVERESAEPALPRSKNPITLPGNQGWISPTPLSNEFGFVELECRQDSTTEAGFRVTIVRKEVGQKPVRIELVEKT